MNLYVMIYGEVVDGVKKNKDWALMLFPIIHFIGFFFVLNGNIKLRGSGIMHIMLIKFEINI
jgi:hypothetical protein